MKLFEKETCVCCGSQVGALDRLKLADKKYICLDCVDKWCSKEFEINYLSKQTSSQMIEYIEHKKENKLKLESFEVTDKYFDCVLVDMNKGWFIFGKNIIFEMKEDIIRKNYEVFEAKDLTYYDFSYNIKNVKDGIFSSNVKADVLMSVGFENKWYPYAYYGKVLKNWKHQADIVGIITRKVTIYENQRKEDFESYLLDLMLKNGIAIPIGLDVRYDKVKGLEPYRPYLSRMFKIAANNYEFELDLDNKLDNITSDKKLKKQIKNEFKIKK